MILAPCLFGRERWYMRLTHLQYKFKINNILPINTYIINMILEKLK